MALTDGDGATVDTDNDDNGGDGANGEEGAEAGNEDDCVGDKKADVLGAAGAAVKIARSNGDAAAGLAPVTGGKTIGADAAYWAGRSGSGSELARPRKGGCWKTGDAPAAMVGV